MKCKECGTELTFGKPTKANPKGFWYCSNMLGHKGAPFEMKKEKLKRLS